MKQQGGSAVFIVVILLIFASVGIIFALNHNVLSPSFGSTPYLKQGTAKITNPTVTFWQNGVVVTSLSANPNSVFKITGTGWGKDTCLLIYVSTSPVSGGQGARADGNGNISIDNWPTWMLTTTGQPGGSPVTSAVFTFKAQTQGGQCSVKLNGTTVSNYDTIMSQTIPVTL